MLPRLSALWRCSRGIVLMPARLRVVVRGPARHLDMGANVGEHQRHSRDGAGAFAGRRQCQPHHRRHRTRVPSLWGMTRENGIVPLRRRRRDLTSEGLTPRPLDTHANLTGSEHRIGGSPRSAAAHAPGPDGHGKQLSCKPVYRQDKAGGSCSVAAPCPAEDG